MDNSSRFLQKCIALFKKHKIFFSLVSILIVICILVSVIILSSKRDNNSEKTGSVSEILSSENSQIDLSDESISEEASETVSADAPSESEVSSTDSSEISSTESSEESSASDTTSEDKDTSSSVSSESKPSKPSNTSSKVNSSKKPSTSSNNTSSKKPSATKKPTTIKKPTTSKNDFKYNGNTDINDNVFLDSMVYTGYNLKKHIADGNMWVYILASQKRGLGYLSDITYAGGSSGYETTKGGKPDIKAFERKGLVCASYVTYVYFNYLPNVAGIDTSFLTKPKKSYSANDWYIAAKDWVKKGYSKTISFKASKTSSGFINFKPSENIPIGSLMFCCDARNRSDFCSHVSIYAGYKNGYHWVYHVGNENGPEFCAMERMHFGPDPQWPINIITTPKNLRFDAALEITVKDDSGKPIKGVNFTLKNLKTGKTIKLGKTNVKGVIIKEKLPYGKYQLVQTAVKGYKNNKLTQKIELTTKDNSYNKISIVNTKIKPVASSKPESSQSKNSSSVSSKVTSSDKNPSKDVSSKDDTSKETVTSGDNTSSEKTSSKDTDTSSEKILSGSGTASRMPEKYSK